MSSGYNAIYRNDSDLYAQFVIGDRADVNGAYTGAFTATLPFSVSRAEDVCVLRFISFGPTSATATSVLNGGTIPVGFRPVGDCVCYGTINIAGNIILGQFRANANGTLQIASTSVSGANLLVGQNFTSGTLVSQPQDVCLSYRCVVQQP